MFSYSHKPERQAILSGASLPALKEEDVFDILRWCTQNPPIHVVKPAGGDFCFLHFKNEVQAATFYMLYAAQKRILCRTLGTIIVRPTMSNGQTTKYSIIGLQGVLDDSAFCRCQPAQSIPPEQEEERPHPSDRQEQPRPAELPPRLPPNGLEDPWVTHLKRARRELDDKISALQVELDGLATKRQKVDVVINDMSRTS